MNSPSSPYQAAHMIGLAKEQRDFHPAPLANHTIEGGLVELDATIEGLRNGIFRLREQLNGVLIPAGPSPTDEPAYSSGDFAPARQHILACYQSLTALIMVVGDINSRLAVS